MHAVFNSNRPDPPEAAGLAPSSYPRWLHSAVIAGLEKSEEGRVIVRAILGLAKGFGLTTTAEGVEDAEQLEYLKANGCTEGQGYLFSKAVPGESIPALLALSPSGIVAPRKPRAIEAA